MAKIIVNADDYGMSSQINASILKAIKSHGIDSVSVDVCNGIKCLDVKNIQAESITIGLHLNLSEGKPIGGGEGIHELLDANGNYKAAILGLNSRSEVEAIHSEFRHQIDRFRLYFGRNPNHIDSHQHFAFLHPIAFEGMLRLATESRIPIRSPKAFLDPESLTAFCKRVKDRYNIEVPFRSDERATILKEIFSRYRPSLRSEDLYFDFDSMMYEQMSLSDSRAEIILHL